MDFEISNRKGPLIAPRSAISSKPPSNSNNNNSSGSLLGRILPPHPLINTHLELALAALYPLTLLLGSLSTTFRPPSPPAIYSPAHQSYQPPAAAPSYFAQKRNLFNTLFVKLGWAWISLALAAFVAASARAGRAASPLVQARDRAQTRRLALRYAAVTAMWYLTTQWCFGPALIDRSFLLTGGACMRRAEAGPSTSAREHIEHAFTAVACKLEGGTWSGGIDISGHVFLLILGSGMLWMEVLPVVVRLFARGKGVEGEQAVGAGIGVQLVLGVCALCWWMLLMTAAFFHTWSEKLAGLVIAFAGLYVVYVLPRTLPALRQVIGMPGL